MGKGGSIIARASEIAYLSSEDGYTCFTFGSRSVRFRTPECLRRYTDIREWDHGYLVVGADYERFPTVTEEYIDLIPILDNLYIDADEFLQPIKEVQLR